MDRVSRIEALERLANLRRSGHLTDSEFEDAKAKIIGSANGQEAETPANVDEPLPRVEARSDFTTIDAQSQGASFQYEPEFLDDEPHRSISSVILKISAVTIPVLLIATAYVYLTRDGDSATYAVTASTLNCRAEPSTDAKALDQLSLNSEVDVTEEREGWMKVNREQQDCWVASDYLRPASSK